jgi:hypothetical protein
LAFENDTANDWAFDLEDVDDLSLVKSALDEVMASEGDYLDSDVACNAIAACEVIARLRGRPGYTDAYTEEVDKWVAKHKGLAALSTDLFTQAATVIDRILGEDSELRQLWEESDGEDWRASVEDLRQRLHT